MNMASVTNAANPQTLKSALDVPMIQIRGLTKSYGDHTVLKGIDFEVDASQVVVVIGPSALGGVGDHLVAELITLCGPIAYASAMVLMRRHRHIDPVSLTTGAFVAASLVLVPLAFMLENPLGSLPDLRGLVTLVALATLGLLNVPTAVPVMLTTSPVYHLPSLLVPAPAATLPDSWAVPLTVAVGVLSYVLLTLRPVIVMSLGVIFAVKPVG